MERCTPLPKPTIFLLFARLEERREKRLSEINATEIPPGLKGSSLQWMLQGFSGFHNRRFSEIVAPSEQCSVLDELQE